jgi:hypothetical protein
MNIKKRREGRKLVGNNKMRLHCMGTRKTVQDTGLRKTGRRRPKKPRNHLGQQLENGQKKKSM